jgi:hypothetical protein
LQAHDIVAQSTTEQEPNGLSSGTATANDVLEGVASALRSHNVETLIVDSADEARDAVLRLIPEGAEVHSGKSKTLEEVGALRRADG